MNIKGSEMRATVICEFEFLAFETVISRMRASLRCRLLRLSVLTLKSHKEDCKLAIFWQIQIWMSSIVLSETINWIK